MKTAGSVLGLLLALAAACSPKPPVTHDPFGLSAKPTAREADATVVLLDPVTLEPHCSATSVVLNDRPVLVTAAHCVTHEIGVLVFKEKIAEIGDQIHFVSRRNWGKPNGSTCASSIVSYDAAHDRAVLRPDDESDLPEPLPVAGLCERCSLDDYAVHSVSSLYGWTEHVGEVNGRTIEDGVGFWTSSISIWYGWSGSPVINQSGQVVGLVSKCRPAEIDGHKQCSPGYSILTDVR